MPSAERDTGTAFRLTRCGMHVSSTFQPVVKLSRNDVIGQTFEFPSVIHINACYESFAGLLKLETRFSVILAYVKLTERLTTDLGTVMC